MTIVLFHSALGLRAVERDLAGAFRADGHDVLVPDLYDGMTADSVEGGLALKDAVGWTAIQHRARQALRDVPATAVLAGVSMGAGVVSEIWPERAAAQGVLLIHGHAAIPERVAIGVRASLHVALGDPFAPDETIAQWQVDAAAQGVEAQVHRYQDVGHFFTDPTLADYDETAARALTQRARAFLRVVG